MSTEKSAPKVSIVIPVYNREKYLGIAVDSVLRQTYVDWELIISDDGSTDSTLNIANNFALYDSRINVLTAEHKGAVHALIAGFDVATGELIGQLDSDDLLEPQAIELTVKALDEHPEWGMVYTNYIDISASGQKTRPGKRCSIPYSKERLLTDFMVFHFRVIRKSVYQDVGGFNVKFNRLEDYELCLRLSEMTDIGKINDYLYQYRIHPESLSVTMNELEKIQLCKKAITQALIRRHLDRVNKVKVSLTATFSIEKILN